MTGAAGGVSVLSAMVGKVEATAPKPMRTPLSVLPGEKPGPSILTPQPKPLPETPAMFPSDQPTEVVQAMIRDLIRQRDALTGVIDGLRLLVGDPEVTQTELARMEATTKTLVEKEADRRIESGDATTLEDVVGVAEARDRKRAMMLAATVEAGGADVAEDLTARFARLKAEAQASVHGDAEDHLIHPTAAEPPPTGWVCPSHGKAETKTSARRNRQYQGCPEAGCGEFERL